MKSSGFDFGESTKSITIGCAGDPVDDVEVLDVVAVELLAIGGVRTGGE